MWNQQHELKEKPVRLLTPSPTEQKRARTGYYASFEEMPRIVREWAQREGYVMLSHGVVKPRGADNGGQWSANVRERLGAFREN